MITSHLHAKSYSLSSNQTPLVLHLHQMCTNRLRSSGGAWRVRTHFDRDTATSFQLRSHAPYTIPLRDWKPFSRIAAPSIIQAKHNPHLILTALPPSILPAATAITMSTPDCNKGNLCSILILRCHNPIAPLLYNVLSIDRYFWWQLFLSTRRLIKFPDRLRITYPSSPRYVHPPYHTIVLLPRTFCPTLLIAFPSP